MAPYPQIDKSQKSLTDRPIPREFSRVLRAGRSQEDSPVVELEASEFRNPRASFLVDPGSDINLIKLRALQKEIIIETFNCISITGITNELVKTIGTVQVTIFSTPVEFHVIENTLPVSPEGILVRPYLRQEQAQISFRHNTLVTVSNPITPIPFDVRRL